MEVWGYLKFFLVVKLYYSRTMCIERCIDMRTNIVLEDELINEAILLSGLKTKKETVELALREFVRNRKRKNLLDLQGKVLIDPKYNYKKLRK